jgi:hypothetical protein
MQFFELPGFLLPNTPPNISIARLLITSFTFMLDCVPDPVCQITNGKCSSYKDPSITSSHALLMASASLGSRPIKVTKKRF